MVKFLKDKAFISLNLHFSFLIEVFDQDKN